MFCHKCSLDVNPVKVMVNSASGKRDVGDGGGMSGFANQCPECNMPLPPDEPEPVAPVEVESLRPMVMPSRHASAPPPPAKRTGSIVDDLRAELAACDSRIANYAAEVDRIKRETVLEKAKRKGLTNMLAAYERANPPRIEVAS